VSGLLLHWKGPLVVPAHQRGLGTSRCSWKPNPSTATERLDLQIMVKAAQYVQSAGSFIKKEDSVKIKRILRNTSLFPQCNRRRRGRDYALIAKRKPQWLPYLLPT